MCAIKIWDRYLRQFGNYTVFGNVAVSVIFNSFFIITFDLNENFDSFHRKDLVEKYQNILYLKLKKYFFIHENQFLDEK